MFIIDDLLFWIPIKTIKSIAEKVQELADKEFAQENQWQRELEWLVYLRQTKQISQSEYKKKARVILKKLERLQNV